MNKFISESISLGNYFGNSTDYEFVPENIDFTINSSVASKIKAITEKYKISMNAFLLTAFTILMSKYALEEENIIENVVHTENESESYRYSFTKNILSRNDKFKDLCLRTSKQTIELPKNSFNMKENYHHIIFDTVNMINKVALLEELRFGMLVSFSETAEVINGKVIFNTRIFCKNEVEKLFKHFENVIKEVANNPEIELHSIDMLTDEEKKQVLVNFNDTKVEYPKDITIYEVFEEHVKNTPNNIAVVYKNTKLTYKELNERSNSLARILRDNGVKADSIVGIMAERSIEIIVGILAILKAGGAYLPIDPDFPKERINYMLADSKTEILLTQEKFIEEIEYKVSVINLNNEENYCKKTSNLTKQSCADNLAYIIYTSGTTGRPKGVAVIQRSVVRLIINTDYIDFKLNDRLLQTCAMTFDVATFEIWGALFSGIELHLTSKDVLLNADKLGKYLIENNITIMWLTSPLFNNICEQNNTIFNGLRCLLIGGDVVSPKNVSLVREHAPKLTVINGYGPTENTTFSTCYVVKDKFDDTRSIPIGTPIANSTAYVLDKYNKLAPIGVYGELCVGGDGLAKGYLNRPELTAKKFVQNPYISGELMYRTGDLVRWLPDGNIEFLGRVDHQVKIRGFRIELGEIENQLLRDEEITQAVVIAKENDKGNKYLCAYIVAEREITVSEIRESLSQRLPDYMIPAYFIQLAIMPLNNNGKINRKALPEPTGDINTGVEYLAPRNDVEEKLISIWSEVLGVDKIGINDNFFALGGDSLKAIKLITLIQKELTTEVSVGEIFSHSSVKELAEYLGKNKVSEYSAIQPVEKQALYKVSSAQTRMFALNQYSKQEINYNIPYVFILEGKLEKNKVEDSFNKLVERHEAFRTSFELVSDEIMQRVHEKVDFKVEYEELDSSLDINSEVKKFVKPFDLMKAPLLRVKLIKVNENKHILMFDMHHIISDGTSLSIIMEEFAKLYKGENLEDLRIQYKDYTAWESKVLESEAMVKQEEYWTELFSDEIPVLNLPTDYHRPSLQSFEGETISFLADKHLTQKLKKAGKSYGATLYMVLFSAFNILLSKYSRQEDIVIGSAVAGRPHADLHNIVGMFVNTLAIRNYPEGRKKYSEFLQEVKKNSLNAFENQDYPFDKLVEKLDIQRDLSRSALLDAMFILQNTDAKEIKLENVTIKQYEFKGKGSKCDLTLEAEEKDEKIKFSLEYCTKLFNRDTVVRIKEHFTNVLNAIAENPEIQLSKIDMLSTEEKKQILTDFNDTKSEYPRSKSISELFEEQAAKSPYSIAVVCGSRMLTYKDLNEKANSLARKLKQKGVIPNSIVGIFADRSIEMITGAIAILKAGGAYLPIDSDYPNDRIKYMLQDSKADILLTENKFVSKIQFDGTIINLNDDESYKEIKENLETKSNSENLAYVIYTSGTTGRPKGVAVKHKNVVRLVKNTNYITFNEGDRILQTGSITFDASTFEIWGSLLNGYELYITSKEVILNANKLGENLLKNKITILWLTSPLFNKICEENPKIFKGLRYLLVGGDVVSPKNVNLVKKYAPELIVVNGYGPTENTTFSACYVIEKRLEESKAIPIGKPIANSTAYIFDSYNNIVPIGIYGELCVGGDGLAKGYLNNKELTDKKFVENPFEPGQRMYRTGDLVRWQADGNIEFLGRIDHQVKIRGFRIEPAEIESSLLKLNTVKEAIVIDREENGNKYLCAYLVSDEDYSTRKLREELKKHLPDYMIPSYFIKLEEMPLNQNGKINRKLLPLPDGNIVTGAEYAAPRNKVEQKLTQIWTEVLQVSRIGINDDFFTLGGDSLKAIKVAAIVQRELLTEVSVGEIFSHSTIWELAEYLAKTKESEYSAIEPVKEKEFYEVSSSQKRMFALNQFSKNETNYNIPFVLILEGRIEKSRVEESFKKLVERHEAFRTSFEIINDEIVQRTHKSIDLTVDYAELEIGSKEAINSEVKKFVKPFDLSKAPLLRVRLIKLKEDKHVLMFDMHHIISDGTSISIVMEEFTKLYKGENLSELRVQYKDYSDWQNEMLRSDVMKKHEEYWVKVFADEIPVLNLPTDYQRPSMQSFEGECLGFKIDKQLVKKLKGICKASGSTLYMVLLSAYTLLLSKYTGQDDIVIGSPIAGRPHADLQNILGMFINTLAMRNYPNRRKTFNEFLLEVKKNALNAYEHQDYPFDKLVDKLDVKRELSRNALFDAMFILQNTENKEIELDDVSIKQFNFERGVSKFDITLEAEEIGEEIKFNLEYCTKLFKKQTILRLIDHFTNILKVVAENPQTKLGEIDMLSEHEKKQILIDFNNTKTAYPSNKTICEYFEEQVKKAPDNLAVVYDSQQITYKELNEKANSLARYLRDKGVKPDSIIGIMVDRSLEMMIGIIAILKAGAAYMPMSPDYPAERIRYMLKDSQTNILLTQKHLLNTVTFDGIVIDLDDKQLYQQNNTNLEIVNNPNNLAYVIYTSGSTGKPKGVMIQHGSVINLVTALGKNIYTSYSEPLNVSLIAPYVFDASVKQIFAGLLRGNCLHIIQEEYRYIGEKLIEYYISNSIDISDGTPSHFKLILSDNTEKLKDIPVKHFIIGGEKLPINIVKEMLSYFDKKPKITNIYGPTECTVDTTAYLVDNNNLDTLSTIPIGQPLANYNVYVVDKDNNLQPVGVAGELCIAGDGLARGYLNKPEMTKAKFVPNPFAANKKMYKTGDLVRWQADGNIEFLGRIDFQVKIRGYRIEVGEIESTIKSSSSVQDAVVLARDDKSGEKQLVAYVVPNMNSEYSKAKLKDYLKNNLPKYMIPGFFVELESIPLNNNGKVDRFALPEPDMQQRGSSDSFVEPRNKAELEMAEIWAKTLGIERVGIDDDFFDIGGDSFKAIKLVRSVSSKLGVMELFKNSTIRELVTYLSGDSSTERTMLNELTKPVADEDRVASLICFPFGGGSAISYQPLANALPKNYSLYAVELPGHDYSRPDEDLISIEESAARCLEEIKQTVKGPMVLYGHCLGATMAAYLAYKLEEAGMQVDGVFVGAMFPAPRITNVFFKIWDKIFPSQLTDKGNKDLLRTIGGLSSDISPEETEFILRNLKHDSKECIKWYTQAYNNKENLKFNAPITCVIGDGDRVTEFYQERYKEWEFFSDSVDLRTIENGGHFFFKNQAMELTEVIEEKIDAWQGRSTVSKEAEVAATMDMADSFVEYKAPVKKRVAPSMSLFLTVAIVQILSEIGSIIAAFGTGIWIFQQTNALSDFAIMLLFRIVPTIIIMPFSGAIVDRFNRRLILIFGDIIAAVGSCGLLLLMYNNSLEIWHIYVFTVLASIATSFRQPAYLAAVTQITPKMFLTQANSVAQFSGAIGGIIAPICGGLFMSSIGLKGLVTIDFVSFLIAIVVLSFLRFPDTMFTKSEEPILKELMGGWNFIVKRKSMVAMVAFFLLVNFILSIFVVTMTPLILSFGNESMLGIINAFLGVGMLIGSIAMLATGGLQKRAKGMVGFVIPLGLSIFIAGLRPLPIFSALAFFGVYFSIAVVDIHWRSLIQVKVGLELQGRVFAVNRMLVSILTPLSYVTAGVLADRIFAPLMQSNLFNLPIVNLILGQGAGREMRLTLLLAGAALFVWGILGMKYRPLSEMDNILEDASQGKIVVKDKDRLQAILDKKQI